VLWLAIAAALLIWGLAARRASSKPAGFGWLVAALALVGLVLAARFGPRFLAVVAPTLGLWAWSWLRSKASSRPGPAPSEASARRAAMTREEALRVLGLNDEATPAEIVAAHRSLIKKVHPDHGGSALLAQQVNEAKRVLSEA
jgi:hypothetical protein